MTSCAVVCSPRIRRIVFSRRTKWSARSGASAKHHSPQRRTSLVHSCDSRALETCRRCERGRDSRRDRGLVLDSPRLPTPTAEAAHYYQLGTDALREGAFHSAAEALNEAVRLFPNFPLAYARLAQAHAETDDDRAATEDLVRVSDLAPDMSRLSRDERLRLDAIRALVLAKTDPLFDAYRELARGDHGCRCLGRSRPCTRGRRQLNDARTSPNAPSRSIGYTRRADFGSASSKAFRGARTGARRLYRSERLYRAASNKEGETEVLSAVGNYSLRWRFRPGP